jgi:RNA polymerase sigma-70 factor (ECF subfamily)
VGKEAIREGGGQGFEPTPADPATFGRMLEQSSLGSDTSRQARRDGAEVLAQYSPDGIPWLDAASTWPDIAVLHRQIAELFEGEGRPNVGELWLRAALARAIDGPTATWLGALLEQRQAITQAHDWYLRATAKGDRPAAARLASLSELAGQHDLATLLVEIGRSTMPPGEAARVAGLVKVLEKAGQRRRATLLRDCDDDLLFWLGCEALVSGFARTVSVECFSAAMINGHHLATLALYDLSMLSAPEEEDRLAEVRSITEKIAQAAQTEPAEAVTPLAPAGEPGAAKAADLDPLVLKAMSGDHQAAARVLEIIRPLVRRYCRARLARNVDMEDVIEDVTQEVCLAVLTALPGYRQQGRPFLAFVYGIASQKVIEAYRAAASDPIALGTGVPEIADEGAEQRALRIDLTRELARQLDQLPEKQREILVLRVVVGLSAEETAKAVGSTPGAVRVAQHRALVKLRKFSPEDVV